MVRIIINLVTMITGKIVIAVVGTMINVVVTAMITMTEHLYAAEAAVIVEAEVEVAAVVEVEVLLRSVVEIRIAIGYQNKHEGTK